MSQNFNNLNNFYMGMNMYVPNAIGKTTNVTKNYFYIKLLKAFQSTLTTESNTS